MNLASDRHKNTHLCKWSHDHVFSMSAKTQTQDIWYKNEDMHLDLKEESSALLINPKVW